MSPGMQVEGYQYRASQNRMRMRIFNVNEDVKQQHAFVPIVSRCAQHAGQPLLLLQGPLRPALLVL